MIMYFELNTPQRFILILPSDPI